MILIIFKRDLKKVEEFYPHISNSVMDMFFQKERMEIILIYQ